ncbi:unnamed protein product [Polarella glacialis]|uniref:Uncharacterized protein n=1 Tax=Polarella glacialis TaxID=89957 RepID=A0A813I782_POLGL|nr:unnamed protein product [Polarella glacialis]
MRDAGASSDEGESAIALVSDSELSFGGVGLSRFGVPAATPSSMTPTLAGVLGAGRVRMLGSPAGDQSGSPASMQSSSAVFAQVLKVVASLQGQLQESEPLVFDLQAKADSLEEKRRLLLRRAEHAERDRDVAVHRCTEGEASARRAREEAAPAVARFMEAEVLRSQLQVASEDLLRLKHEDYFLL